MMPTIQALQVRSRDFRAALGDAPFETPRRLATPSYNLTLTQSPISP
jgi:hypothetical protein